MSSITPMSDWLLVEIDEFPEKQGSLIVLEDSSPNRVRTGTVKAVGPGRKHESKRIPVGVEKGEKVAFLRWNLEHKSAKQQLSFLETFGNNLGLIRAADVLFAFSPSESIQIT